MLLVVCPDTVAGHRECLRAINQRISELRGRLVDLERQIYVECRPKLNANQKVLTDACEELTRILLASNDPFYDLILKRDSWNLGVEAVQLRETVDGLREHKRRLEDEWRGAAGEIERLKAQREIHVELIAVLEEEEVKI